MILKYAGKDATEAFFGELEHSHSTKALRMLNHYQIGVLDSAAGNSSHTRELGSILDSKLASLVDMNKAILPQVNPLQALCVDHVSLIHNKVIDMNPPDMYQKWLGAAHSATITIRIFQRDILEACSRWPWWYIFPLVKISSFCS